MTETPVYFVHTGGKQVGPVTYADLDDMAARGSMQPDDLVWQSGTPDWVAASTLFSFTPKAPSPAPPAGEAVVEKPVGPPAASIPAPKRTAKELFRSLVDDLGSFSFSELVPISRVVDPETLGTPASWVLLVFGLGPLLLGTVVEDPRVRVRLFNFACGALWTAFFVFAFKSDRQSSRLGIASFLSTAIFGVLFVSVLQGVPPLSWLFSAVTPDRSFVVRLLGFTLGVGLLEEVGKGLILLLLARQLGGLRCEADGVFYGLMSGLGFGVYEAMQYTEAVSPKETMSLTFHSQSLTVGLYAAFIAQVVRIVSLPLLHAIWTAIVGYFIGLSFRVKRKSAAVIGVGLLIATVLHGLYDAFVSERLGLAAFLVATLTLLLFLSYRRNADRLLAEAERAGPA
jgi:RsiW-degrading membrane proteinase PrsW (M82 family)